MTDPEFLEYLARTSPYGARLSDIAYRIRKRGDWASMDMNPPVPVDLPEDMPPPSPGYRWWKNDLGSWQQVPNRCDPKNGYHATPHVGCLLR